MKSSYRIDAENGLVYGLNGSPIRNVGTRGYIRINRRGKSISSVHKMIWESVHGQIPNGMQINHKNGIKTDNRLCNLELVTPSANTLHAYQTGLASAVGEQNGRAILTESDVVRIRESTATHATLAREYGVSRRTIGDVKARLRWRHVP